MKIMTIVGTRPEIIRLSQVVARLDQLFEHKLVHTGQNYDFELNEVFFKELGIRKPDFYLGAAAGTSAKTIAKVIELTDELLIREAPDAVLVLGDTNSCLSVIAAKKRHIPIFHMEAGNRSFDSRVPEEINRKIIDHVSDINLAYTEHARRNLIAEGIPADQIFVTGSPLAEVLHRHKDGIANSSILERLELRRDGFILASFHREENVDNPKRLTQIVKSLNQLAIEYRMPIVLSTHPRTKNRLSEIEIQLSDQIKQLKPFGFLDYVRLQKESFCVISDSGTITEESSIANFPAVTPREAHERPEGMDSGVLVMVDIDTGSIIEGVRLARMHFESEKARNVPIHYQDIDVSWRVAKIILSYTNYINRRTWRKILSE